MTGSINLNEEWPSRRTNIVPLAEFVANVSIWQCARPAIAKKPQKKKKSRRGESSSHFAPPSTADDSPRRLKERSSWLAIPRTSPATSPVSTGSWVPARCYLRELDESICDLAVYDEDGPLLYSILVNELRHTDVRQVHRSLFFCPNILGIHYTHGQATGSVAGEHEAATALHLQNIPPIPNPSSPTHSAFSSVPSPPPSPPPFYIRFPTTDIFNLWLSLFRSYAKPEICGAHAVTGPEAASTGGLYRMWRGVELEIVEGKCLMASNSGGWSDRDFLASMTLLPSNSGAGDHDASNPSSSGMINPSSSSRTPAHSSGPTPASSFSLSSSSATVDYDIFCEVYLDNTLSGRTTSKRISSPPSAPPLSSTPATSSMSTFSSHRSFNHSTKDPSVIWHESLKFPDLPSHGTMTILVYRARSPSAHSPTLSTSSSSSALAAALSISTTSSASSSHQEHSPYHHPHHLHFNKGVALIGAAGGKFHKDKDREREPVVIGTVEIVLANFRRGEWVEGWWSIIPSSGVGAAEVKLRLKVDEEVILPAASYDSLLSIISTQNPLDLISSPTTASLESHSHPVDSTGRSKPQRSDTSSTIASSTTTDLAPSPLPAKPGRPPLILDNTHHLHVAQHLHVISAQRGVLVPYILQMLTTEIESFSANPHTLFRGNTVLTKTVEFAMSFYGRAWLELSVGRVVRQMVKDGVAVEVDVARLRGSGVGGGSGGGGSGSFGATAGPGGGSGGASSMSGLAKELEANVRLLVKCCKDVWDGVWNARGECPTELRIIFKQIRTLVDARWSNLPSDRRGHGGGGGSTSCSPRTFNASEDEYTSDEDGGRCRTEEEQPDYQNLRYQSISSFMFLRFIVPAILTPHLFGLIDGLPSPPVMRTLRVVAKHIQSLANLSTTIHQEEHMRAMKNFLKEQNNVMIDYLLYVSEPSHNDLPPIFTASTMAGSPPSSGTQSSSAGSTNPWERSYSASLFTSSGSTRMMDTASLSSLRSFKSIPGAVGPGHDREATIAFLRDRMTKLPLLHRESVPILPHLVDISKHLAIISSTVVRNARGARRQIGYSKEVVNNILNGVYTSPDIPDAPVPPLSLPESIMNGNGTRGVGYLIGAEAKSEDFQMVCFEIHADALGRVAKLTGAKSHKPNESKKPVTLSEKKHARKSTTAKPTTIFTKPTFAEVAGGRSGSTSPTKKPATPSPGGSRGHPGPISISAANASLRVPSRSVSASSPGLDVPSPSASSIHPAADSPSSTSFSPILPISPKMVFSRGPPSSSESSHSSDESMSLENAIGMGPPLRGPAAATTGSSSRSRTIRPASVPAPAPSSPAAEYDSGASTDSFREPNQHGIAMPLRTRHGHSGLGISPHNDVASSFASHTTVLGPNATAPPALYSYRPSYLHHAQGSSGDQAPPPSAPSEEGHPTPHSPRDDGPDLYRAASNPSLGRSYPPSFTQDDPTAKKKKSFFRGFLPARSSKNA